LILIEIFDGDDVQTKNISKFICHSIGQNILLIIYFC